MRTPLRIIINIKNILSSSFKILIRIDRIFILPWFIESCNYELWNDFNICLVTLLLIPLHFSPNENREIIKHMQDDGGSAGNESTN